MPAKEFESFLQGARAGDEYVGRQQQGAQKMNLENLMSGNRIGEYKATNYEDVPEASLHPAFKAFSAGPGKTPGTLSFNRAIIGDAQKAAEAAIARENRVKEAQGLVRGLVEGAPGGDISKLPRPHQQVIATLTRMLDNPNQNSDVDQKFLTAGHDLLVPKITMGTPGQVPTDSVTGEPVGKAIPFPDLSGIATGGAPGEYQPPKIGVSSHGPSIDLSPLPPPFVAFHRQLEANGIKYGTDDYKNAMGEFASRVPMGPDSQVTGVGTDIINKYKRGGGALPSAAPGTTTPGGIVARPPTATQADIQSVSDAQTWIKSANEVADALDAMSKEQSTAGRLSMGLRNTLQGVPYLGSHPFLDPAEQEVISRAKELAIDWEKAKGGMRMAASTGMINRVGQIIRDPSNAMSASSFRSVAEEMKRNLKTTGGNEPKGGRREMSTPPPQPKSGSAAAAGATGSSAPVPPNTSAIPDFRSWAAAQAARGRK